MGEEFQNFVTSVLFWKMSHFSFISRYNVESNDIDWMKMVVVERLRLGKVPRFFYCDGLAVK